MRGRVLRGVFRGGIQIEVMVQIRDLCAHHCGGPGSQGWLPGFLVLCAMNVLLILLFGFQLQVLNLSLKTVYF